MSGHNDKAPDYVEDSHLSPQVKEYLAVLNSGGRAMESMPPEMARQTLRDIQDSIEVDLSGIDESEKTINEDKYSVRITIVKPAEVKEESPVFIFVHGGGWVIGDYPTHRRLVRDLVVASGYTAVFVNYTHSPAVMYPEAINEVFAVVKWVARHGGEIGVDGSRMALVGNSAGGNMAMAASFLAKENEAPEIKLQVLLWPVADYNFDTESYRLYGEDRYLTTPLMKWFFNHYTNDASKREEIYHSPLRATQEEMEGLPPTVIQVAENDILRDEGEALGRKLEEAGVETVTVRYNGVIHDWGMLNGCAGLPQTKALVLFTAAMLKKYLNKKS